MKTLKAQEQVCAVKGDKLVPATVEPEKNILTSKVFLFAVAQFLLVKYGPHIDDWVEKNSHWYAGIIGIVLIYLRIFTAGKIKWNFWKKPNTMEKG